MEIGAAHAGWRGTKDGVLEATVEAMVALGAQRDRIHAVIGPNGAGKSSLMRTLATLQEADSGTATLDDIDIFNQPAELRKVLGYLPQEFGVYPRITAEQLLTHLAILKGITSTSERKELVKYLHILKLIK